MTPDPDILPVYELAEARAREDERQLLGLALTDPERAVEVLALLPAYDCSTPEHAALVRLLSERLAHGESLEVVDIVQTIARDQRRYGGAGYVASLPEHAPPAAIDLRALAARCRQRATRRMLGQIGEILTRASKGEEVTLGGDALPDHPDALASAVALHLSRLAEPSARTEWTLAEAIDEALQTRRRTRESGRQPTISTAVRELDSLLDGGLRAGELVVIAGRPGSGKTACALGLASEAAQAGARVGVVSLEMGAPELSDRLLARASRVPLSAIRRGEVDDEPVMNDWRDEVSSWRIRISAPSSITPAGIVTTARRWAARGLDLLVIDYLQLVRHVRAERHDLAVGATATLCKQLARDLQIPVILLSQLNRGVEQRSSGPVAADEEGAWWDLVELPRLSDLRDSGQIEQDADMVLFPLQAELLGVDLQGAACLVVAKNRNGRVGVAPLRWDGPTASYRAVSGRSA